jgi:hypothetical protein
MLRAATSGDQNYRQSHESFGARVVRDSGIVRHKVFSFERKLSIDG